MPLPAVNRGEYRDPQLHMMLWERMVVDSALIKMCMLPSPDSGNIVEEGSERIYRPKIGRRASKRRLASRTWPWAVVSMQHLCQLAVGPCKSDPPDNQLWREKALTGPNHLLLFVGS